MKEEKIKQSSSYDLAQRLFQLSQMKRQTKRVEDEYNLIVEEMWSRSELLKGEKGLKKMIRKTKGHTKQN